MTRKEAKEKAIEVKNSVTDCMQSMAITRMKNMVPMKEIEIAATVMIAKICVIGR